MTANDLITNLTTNKASELEELPSTTAALQIPTEAETHPANTNFTENLPTEANIDAGQVCNDLQRDMQEQRPIEVLTEVKCNEENLKDNAKNLTAKPDDKELLETVDFGQYEDKLANV